MEKRTQKQKEDSVQSFVSKISNVKKDAKLRKRST